MCHNIRINYIYPNFIITDLFPNHTYLSSNYYYVQSLYDHLNYFILPLIVCFTSLYDALSVINYYQ